MAIQKIRFIDLFSGIGGMRLGFESAAHSLNMETECVLSSEINPDAQSVYQANFGDTPSGDIRLIDQLPEHDILLAGFPCQSFSYAGKKAGFGDTRGTLFFEIARLIDTFKPLIFRINITGNQERAVPCPYNTILGRGTALPSPLYHTDVTGIDIKSVGIRIIHLSLLFLCAKSGLCG